MVGRRPILNTWARKRLKVKRERRGHKQTVGSLLSYIWKGRKEKVEVSKDFSTWAYSWVGEHLPGLRKAGSSFTRTAKFNSVSGQVSKWRTERALPPFSFPFPSSLSSSPLSFFPTLLLSFLLLFPKSDCLLLSLKKHVAISLRIFSCWTKKPIFHPRVTYISFEGFG